MRKQVYNLIFSIHTAMFKWIDKYEMASPEKYEVYAIKMLERINKKLYGKIVIQPRFKESENANSK